MPDSIYDKLGDLLNDALDSGDFENKDESFSKIKDSKEQECENQNLNSKINFDSSTLFFNTKSENKTFKKSFFRKKKIATGKVYKADEYNFTPSYPENIKQALRILQIDINSKINLKNVKKAYRIMLKKNHPDMLNKNNSTETVKIIEAYKLLETFFNS